MERNIRMLGLGAIVRAFGISLILPFLALYLRNVLGIGFEEVGLLTVAVAIPPLFLTPVGGLLADRVGRRRLFVATLAAEAGFLLATAGAMRIGNLPLVFVALTSLNIVGSLGGPALSAYVADFAVGSERTQGFTWTRIGHNLGFTLGTLFGGAFVGLIGFVDVAAIASVFSGITAVFALVVLAPSPFDRELASVPAPLVPARPAPPSVRESLRILAHDRTFLLLCVAFGFASLVAGQWVVTFPLFVVDDLHVSYAILGAGLALNGVVVVLGQSAMTGALAGRRHTTIAIGGTAAYALGFAVLAVSGEGGTIPLVAFFGAVFILTLGENLLWIPQSTLPSNVAPPSEIGSYNGAFQTVGSIGVLAATALGGWALGAIHDPLAIWALLLVPLPPAIALLVVAGRRIEGLRNRA